MKIENEIISSVIAAVKELYGQDVPEKMVALQKTKSNFEGNLTLVVFPFLKMSKKKPEDTAQEIGEYLKKNCANVIADFNVVKGFLNLSIAPAAWVGLLNNINADPKFGEKPVTENSPLVMIEYSSPNTNKPLHLGHVRNNLLGWSLAQIMEANGNKVIKTNIVNDRGIHICKSMLAWLKWGNGETRRAAHQLALVAIHELGQKQLKQTQDDLGTVGARVVQLAEHLLHVAPNPTALAAMKTDMAPMVRLAVERVEQKPRDRALAREARLETPAQKRA